MQTGTYSRTSWHLDYMWITTRHTLHHPPIKRDSLAPCPADAVLLLLPRLITTPVSFPDPKKACAPGIPPLLCIRLLYVKSPCSTLRGAGKSFGDEMRRRDGRPKPQERWSELLKPSTSVMTSSPMPHPNVLSTAARPVAARRARLGLQTVSSLHHTALGNPKDGFGPVSLNSLPAHYAIYRRRQG